MDFPCCLVLSRAKLWTRDFPLGILQCVSSVKCDTLISKKHEFQLNLAYRQLKTQQFQPPFCYCCFGRRCTEAVGLAYLMFGLIVQSQRSLQIKIVDPCICMVFTNEFKWQTASSLHHEFAEVSLRVGLASSYDHGDMLMKMVKEEDQEKVHCPSVEVKHVDNTPTV